MELVYKHEKKLFVIAVIIATLLWVALIAGTFGIALLYLLLAFIAYLFIHSGFIAYLRGTGVRISEAQYPDLHKRLLDCCEKIGLKKIPSAYILRTDFFNALATRFLGRNFVVLFTDVLDSLESQPGAINFYIGHELGHVHRNHLKWGWFLMPALVLPMLGTAYRRAEESTCDRYGAVCCETDVDVCNALAAIAAGDTRWKTINANAYVKQAAITNGFWMSFHELTNDYPWMTKRMARAMAMRMNKSLKLPRRHTLAWILSAFVPRFGAGGGASLLIMIAVLGILAAIALPAYQDFKQRGMDAMDLSSSLPGFDRQSSDTASDLDVAYAQALPVKEQISDYYRANQAWPLSLSELGYDSNAIFDDTGGYEISIYDDGVIGIHVGMGANGEGQYIVLEPGVSGGDVFWLCYGQNLDEVSLPAACRK